MGCRERAVERILQAGVGGTIWLTLCADMNPDIVILKNAPLKGDDVEQLRREVGWQACEGLYGQVLKRSHATYSVSTAGRLVAFLDVLSDGVSYAFLTDLVVHPSAQRQGIGMGLLQRAAADLSAEGVRYVQAVHDPELDAFYRKAGFSIIHAASIAVWKGKTPETCR